MPNYTLRPNSVNCTYELHNWSNSFGETITTVNSWGNTEIFVKCDEKPTIQSDESGISILAYFEDEYSNGNLTYNLDNCYESVVYKYPAEMRRKRKEWIDDLWEEHRDLDKDGWAITSTELWVFEEVTVVY